MEHRRHVSRSRGHGLLTLAGAVTVLLSAGCAHPPQPYVFTVPQSNGQILELLAKRLEGEGHKVGRIDRAAREISSYWEDTHYQFRETPDGEHGTNIFVRYRVALENRPDGAQVVKVTADVQRCAADSSYVTVLGVSGICVPMKRMVPSHQDELDRLGQRLSAGIAPAASTGA